MFMETSAKRGVMRASGACIWKLWLTQIAVEFLAQEKTSRHSSSAALERLENTTRSDSRRSAKPEWKEEVRVRSNGARQFSLRQLASVLPGEAPATVQEGWEAERSMAANRVNDGQ